MRKALTVSAALAIALCGAGCAQNKPAEETQPAVEQTSETTEPTEAGACQSAPTIN